MSGVGKDRPSLAVRPSRSCLSSNEVRPISSHDFLTLMLEENKNNDTPKTGGALENKDDRKRMVMIPQGPMVNNSNLVYWSIPLPCGLTVRCRPEVLWHCPKVLMELQQDSQQCLKVLPPSVHSLIKTFPIWVNLSYSYGPLHHPKHVRHSTAHHHEAWLIWACDRPEKAPGVEIYNCWDYRKMRWHWNGCGLLLHEMCHLIHQFCLGLDHEGIQRAWLRCSRSERYRSGVLRRDWAGLETGDTDMAYAILNAKEWFAEMSVAYLSTGYQQCCSNGNATMEESSPPIWAPHVLARQKKKLPETTNTTNTLPPHCNKFYPFTNQQLRNFDPESYQLMDELWRQIAQWQDNMTILPYRNNNNNNNNTPITKRCWPF